MRDLRIQGGRPARASGDWRSGRRSNHNFLDRTARRLRQFLFSDLGLVSGGFAADAHADRHRDTSKPSLDDRPCWPASSSVVRPFGQGNLPAAPAVRLRAAHPVLGLADADLHRDRHPKAPEQGGQRSLDPGLEAHPFRGRRKDEELEGRSAAPTADIVRPRLIINSRKKAADLVRTFQNNPAGSYLRAVFVGQECAYLGSTIVAEGESEIRILDYGRVLEQAYLLGAAAFLLVRRLPGASSRLSRDEVAKAKQLYRIGEELDLFLFDYIVIEGETESSLFPFSLAARKPDVE